MATKIESAIQRAEKAYYAAINRAEDEYDAAIEKLDDAGKDEFFAALPRLVQTRAFALARALNAWDAAIEDSRTPTSRTTPHELR